jgi:hypothetical protein
MSSVQAALLQPAGIHTQFGRSSSMESFSGGYHQLSEGDEVDWSGQKATPAA